MHRAAAKAITVTKAWDLNNGIRIFNWNNVPPRLHQPEAHVILKSQAVTQLHVLPKLASQNRNTGKVLSMRRRRANLASDTYVLMEPGESEVFVSEDELRAKLKNWLQNWPGKALPPDLARFENIDDAVSFLVSSVCELEIDGDVGSIQWYEVRLQ